MATGTRACSRWASPSPTPTACGGSPSTPTAASWPTSTRTRRRIREPGMTSGREDRRRHHRQRLRRRHRGLPPRGGRREGDRAGARAVAGREDFEHDYLLGSSYTRVFDFIVGRRDERARRQLRRRRQRGVLRRHAARAAVHLRAAGQHRPPDVAGAPSTATTGSLVRQGRRVHPGQPAGLERRLLRRWAVGRGVQPRGPHGEPGAGRHRQRHLHELQLDDGGLQVRREALAAARTTCPALWRTARRSGRCTRSNTCPRPTTATTACTTT